MSRVGKSRIRRTGDGSEVKSVVRDDSRRVSRTESYRWTSNGGRDRLENDERVKFCRKSLWMTDCGAGGNRRIEEWLWWMRWGKRRRTAGELERVDLRRDSPAPYWPYAQAILSPPRLAISTLPYCI